MAKTKKLPAFKGWEEVNQALREIGDIDRQVFAIEASLNESINQLKGAAEEKIFPLSCRKEQLENDIQAYTEFHIQEFTDSKTKNLTFGKVGFRKVTSLVTRNVKAIIEALKQNKMQDCLNIKVVIDKDELAKYDDASLKKIGASRVTKDKFFYEPDVERIES